MLAMLLFITRKFEETFENTDDKSQLVAIFCSEREPSVILIAILNNPGGSGNAAVRGCQKEKCCSGKIFLQHIFAKIVGNLQKLLEMVSSGQHSTWWPSVGKLLCDGDQVELELAARLQTSANF